MPLPSFGRDSPSPNHKVPHFGPSINRTSPGSHPPRAACWWNCCRCPVEKWPTARCRHYYMRQSWRRYRPRGSGSGISGNPKESAETGTRQTGRGWNGEWLSFLGGFCLDLQIISFEMPWFLGCVNIWLNEIQVKIMPIMICRRS